MEMPKPGEAHARLHKLAGRWTGAETLHPAPWDPAGGPATGAVENRVVLDGFVVVQEYQQTRGGAPNFAGHGMFWWDAAAGEYVMTWFDSMMGTPAEYRGDFEGDVLRLRNELPGGGFSRASFDLSTPDRYVFLMEVSPDGSIWAPAMEGRYTRHSAAPARPGARRAGGKAKKPGKVAKAAKTAKPAKAAAAKRRSAAKGRVRTAAPRRVAASRRGAVRGKRGGRRR
jgi:Protein of unknown function (DUF1579)